ncbi:protein amalgam [Penaeus vannamei]|uniref:protein amalgam n=1 Tax=Penaeus vannamei TaxID=6689 RepID=UPI00387F48F4
MGAQLDGTVVKEGASLYLTCHVDANPPPHTLTFMHEDTEVRQDKAAGVMINVNNLVLSKVRKTQAGHYYCKATNSEGTGVSPPVNITVRYAPVCAEAKDVWAEPGNTVTARCRVNASPEDSISFSWVWVTNSYTRRVIPSHITSEGSASKVEFTVPRDNITELGSNNRMGALQCWAENSVGRQDTPCIVAVRKPALPSAPVNCSLTGAGREVVTVNCEPGDHPSMPQTYLLQIYETNTKKLYRNVTSKTPKSPTNTKAGRRQDSSCVSDDFMGVNPSSWVVLIPRVNKVLYDVPLTKKKKMKAASCDSSNLTNNSARKRTNQREPIAPGTNASN